MTERSRWADAGEVAEILVAVTLLVLCPPVGLLLLYALHSSRR